MADGTKYAKQILILSIVSSIISLLSLILYNFYRAEAGIPAPSSNAPLSLLFQWIGYFTVAMLNLIPPSIIRFLAPGRSLSAEWAYGVSLFNFATFTLVASTPYQLITGEIAGGAAYFALSGIIKMIAQVFTIASGYVILIIPDNNDAAETISIPQDDYTICVTELGNFLNLLKLNSRVYFPVEKLWQQVYNYLKNERVLKNAIAGKGVRHDEMVLNAIGSVAFRLLERSKYCSSPGVLNPEGEYVREIWKLAAHELVRRGYNTPEDMARGLSALHMVIAAPPKELGNLSSR
ncbi:MAG: hypothetical protein LBT08_01530 [Synergistaceae bacterium]|nr:hypothetical protein [Synergistaceae bacterium]